MTGWRDLKHEPTSIETQVATLCGTATEHQKNLLVTGDAGLGKSRAAILYARKTQTVYCSLHTCRSGPQALRHLEALWPRSGVAPRLSESPQLLLPLLNRSDEISWSSQQVILDHVDHLSIRDLVGAIHTVVAFNENVSVVLIQNRSNPYPDDHFIRFTNTRSDPVFSQFADIFHTNHHFSFSDVDSTDAVKIAKAYSASQSAIHVVEELSRNNLELSYPVIGRVVRRVRLDERDGLTTQATVSDIMRYSGQEIKTKYKTKRRTVAVGYSDHQ